MLVHQSILLLYMYPTIIFIAVLFWSPYYNLNL